MASLTAETESICLDIAGFQSRVMGLEQRVATVETHIASSQDRDQELLYLHSKMIGLEDRSWRDNIRFLGFPETIEGAAIHFFLRETLPKLTGMTFNPPRVSKRAETRSQATRYSHPPLSDHCLPAVTHAGPPTSTESPHPWALLDGRAGDSDDSGLLQRDQ
ncbi:hypothetical protein NDU88_001905 [Pleurodeles waltl]|uniref:Uncharacterized protein n=1 Tax=Pleurodeles waltl TaxID=8319 RepID=A0AAV7UUN0_PLEWA|nr:hypothetical protein NDU88_001905 [Pleurodeles waltl]